VPTPVGVSLVEAYAHLGIELYKPYLRAQMENDMKLIAQGAKSKDVVLRDCINEMNRIFKRVYENVGVMREQLVAQMAANGGATYIPAPGETNQGTGNGGGASGEERKA
jgi:DNA topoisomerase IA